MESQEYETASDFKEDFNSDNEPPIDKIIEKKMIVKGNSRVYKRILRLGEKTLDKPAKCDLVVIKRKVIEREPDFSDEKSYDEIKPVSIEKVRAEIAKMDEVKEEQLQLGVDELPEREIIAISSMKKGEVGLFEFEEIEKLQSTRERKLMGRCYMLIEYIKGVTIIDTFIDQKVYQIEIKKGADNHRIEPCDRFDFKMSLRNSKLDTLHETQMTELETIDSILEKLPEPFSRITDLRTFFSSLKRKQQVAFEFFPKSYELDEGSLSQESALIETYDLAYPTKPGKFYLFVEIGDLKNFSDVFMDKTTVRMTQEPGYTSSKPELLSKIYFDYAIRVNEVEIFTTFKPEKTELPSQEEKEEFYEKNKYHSEIFAEYDISQMLQKSLMIMKKFEKATLFIHNPVHLKYGADYEVIVDYLQKQHALEGKVLTEEFLAKNGLKLTYEVRVYFFTEGKNNFTVTSEERLDHIQRKKKLVEKLIKQGLPKKALKVLKMIQELCNYGVYDEDKAGLQSYNLSSLLNISLCHWKLGNWSMLKKSCEKVLEVDKTNEKAFYRLALAEFKMLNFEEALEVLGKSKSDAPEVEELRADIKKNIEKTLEKEKKMYRNILSE